VRDIEEEEENKEKEKRINCMRERD